MKPFENEFRVISQFIEAGQSGSSLLVFGDSGIGKSTVLREVTDYHLSLGKKIFYSPAKAPLFSGSILDNILGFEYFSYQRKQEAIKFAIDFFPDETAEVFLNRTIGFGGEGLSTGEMSRVGIARAVVASADSECVVLDEPTLGLDGELSDKFFERIGSLFGLTSLICISHELGHKAQFSNFVHLSRGK